MNSIRLLLPLLLLINLTCTTTALDEMDILQNEQINQIWIEFCASDIDRNRTASAVLKFDRLPVPDIAIKDVVQLHITNYVESFDNLLNFIDQLSSVRLQEIAIGTLIVALKSDLINIVNVLSLDNFFRKKLDSENVSDFAKKMYEEFLNATVDHAKKLVAVTDLNTVPTHTFDSIPTIVLGIDLNNFTDVNRLFEFSMQLPRRDDQLKLLRKVLTEMQLKSQYQHVFHVVCQIKLLRKSINNGSWTAAEEQLLSEIIREMPYQARRLLSESIWQIKSLAVDACLSCFASTKYNKNILILDDLSYNWWIQSQSYNSVMIGDFYNEYLSVDYSFHNETFPTMRERDDSDPAQSNWYFLMSDDLTYVRIKNIYTNDLLISDDVLEIGSDGLSRRRVALSANVSTCDSSKWLLKLRSSRFF